MFLAWLAAHAAQDLDSVSATEAALPLETLSELAAGATPRMARLERQVSRIEGRELALGRPLTRRWSSLFDRYALAVDEAGPLAPLAHTRLGWLMLEQDRQWATFQWVEALDEAPEGPHADWARVGLGGILFDQGDLARAALHYEQVMAGGGLLAPYAALQHGQVSFRSGAFARAVDDFVQAAQTGNPAVQQQAVAELAAATVASDSLTVGSIFERACRGDETCTDAAWSERARVRGTLGFHD